MRLNVTNDDLANIRFAYSPLLELSISYRVLKSGVQSALYYAWVEEARRAIADIEFPFMDSLIRSKAKPHIAKVGTSNPLAGAYVPDFLTPTPLYPVTDIEDEFKRLVQTPNEIIHENIQTMINIFGEDDISHYFLAHPREALFCLVQELREYWKRTLEPHWGRMMSVLENDILHHSRVMTLDGIEALFPALDPSLKLMDGAIQWSKMKGNPSCGPSERKWKEYAYDLEGRGLHLIPLIFSHNMVYHQINEHWQPMMLYTARGAGLWNYESPEPDEALEIVLGAGKARVLMALNDPLNTGELARKLSLTAGAVSQQLSRLHKAGLVESHRNGKNVYYRLSPRGTQLVGLFY